MNAFEFNQFCEKLAGAHMTINWGDHHVWKVFDKMFAIGAPPSDEFHPINFKAGDIAFEMLQERDGLIAAPYLQRAKWIRVETPNAMNPQELQSYLVEAHQIIVSRLSKKRQKELGMLPD